MNVLAPSLGEMTLRLPAVRLKNFDVVSPTGPSATGRSVGSRSTPRACRAALSSKSKSSSTSAKGAPAPSPEQIQRHHLNL